MIEQLVLVDQVSGHRHFGHWDRLLHFEIDRASFLVKYDVASMSDVRVLSLISNVRFPFIESYIRNRLNMAQIWNTSSCQTINFTLTFASRQSLSRRNPFLALLKPLLLNFLYFRNEIHLQLF